MSCCVHMPARLHRGVAPDWLAAHWLCLLVHFGGSVEVPPEWQHAGDDWANDDDEALRQHGAAFADKWTRSERRVRQVLLGHPEASDLAGLPPDWVKCAPLKRP